VLSDEEHAALRRAMTHLDDEDASLLDAHYGTPDRSNRSIAPATAARLARARAKLRVAYVLEHGRVPLPTQRCRPVLEAVSTGDRRRQERIGAGATCSPAAPAPPTRRPWSSGSGRWQRCTRWAGWRSAPARCGAPCATTPAAPPPAPPWPRRPSSAASCSWARQRRRLPRRRHRWPTAPRCQTGPGGWRSPAPPCCRGPARCRPARPWPRRSRPRGGDRRGVLDRHRPRAAGVGRAGRSGRVAGAGQGRRPGQLHRHRPAHRARLLPSGSGCGPSRAAPSSPRMGVHVAVRQEALVVSSP
jgi:hypothetical protein